MTRFIAVGNQKGGVAKTTTCLSLGGCLAEMGKTVLLIDLDPQANLTLSLGIDPDSLRRTVSDALLHNATVLSVSRETGIPGLDILPANAKLAVLDKVLYQCRSYEAFLKQALSALDSSLYDYALMDCAPSVGPLTLNALTVADLLVVPTQAEYYAARSLHNVFELVRLVRLKTNPLLKYRILITMYDRRNAICARILEQMKTAFKEVLFETVIEVDTKLRESPVMGKPVTLYKPSTRGAQQYRALAQELVQDESTGR